MSQKFLTISLPTQNRHNRITRLTFSTQWKCQELDHIIDLDLLPKVMKWAQLVSQTNPNSTTNITINHDDRSNNKFNPLQQKHCHPLNHHLPTHCPIHCIPNLPYILQWQRSDTHLNPNTLPQNQPNTITLFFNWPPQHTPPSSNHIIK